MSKNKELLRTIKFTLFSISAGIIQIGAFTLLFEVFRWSEPISHLVSLVLSVLWNFCRLNKPSEHPFPQR